MSLTFFTWTFPARSASITALQSVNEVLAQVGAPVAKGRTLMSASRNDWLSGAIARAASHFEVDNLGFIVNLNSPVQRDSSGARWTISILDGVGIRDASVGVARLLELAASTAETFGHQIGCIDARDTAATLASASDRYDLYGPEGEEEGDGPAYFFGYLKCMLSLLRFASEQSLCIIHARHEH